jgi:hypothetical protein
MYSGRKKKKKKKNIYIYIYIQTNKEAGNGLITYTLARRSCFSFIVTPVRGDKCGLVTMNRLERTVEKQRTHTRLDIGKEREYWQGGEQIYHEVQKLCPATRHKGAWGERKYSSYLFSTSELDEGKWSASRPGRALPPGKGPLSTQWTGGWVGPRADLDTEARRRILWPLSEMEPRSPGGPARSHILHWLSYPSHNHEVSWYSITQDFYTTRPMNDHYACWWSERTDVKMLRLRFFPDFSIG